MGAVATVLAAADEGFCAGGRRTGALEISLPVVEAATPAAVVELAVTELLALV